jgi:NADH-quinone oxidoreductase subunit C
MSKTMHEVAEYLVSALPESVIEAKVALGELTVRVSREGLLKAMQFLRDDAQCLFSVCMDVCGLDYPARADRFDVVYHLLSLKHNMRVRVKVATDEVTPVDSVVELYPAAGWFEREAWDMYGIFFAGNPDLRRILTDYGFDGHPLRKDFPLTGYVEMRYDPEKQRVVYEPVKLNQAYRNFDNLSPWEGAPRVLPGDEKAAC